LRKWKVKDLKLPFLETKKKALMNLLLRLNSSINQAKMKRDREPESNSLKREEKFHNGTVFSNK